MAKIADMVGKLGEAVAEGYLKIEDKFAGKFLVEDGTPKTGKVGEAVVEGYKKIEDGVVSGYKKLEDSVVEGFGKVSDKFVDKLFARDGETVDDARKRLSGESGMPRPAKEADKAEN